MLCGSDYPRKLEIIKACHETFIKEVFLQVKISEAGVRPHIFNPRNLKQQNQGNLPVFEASLNYIENDSSARTAVDGCTFTRVTGNTTL